METPNTIYDENTTAESSPNKNTEQNPTDSQSPSWKANLSLRWSRKQPTKSELCETFLDLKNSLVVQSNNVVGLNKRIERLERDLGDLIQYINERNI